MALLSDRHWHTTAELNAICFRYGARLFELRGEGYIFDEERIGNGPLWRWRLVETPGQAILREHLARTGAVVEAKREALRGGGTVKVRADQSVPAPRPRRRPAASGMARAPRGAQLELVP